MAFFINYTDWDKRILAWNRCGNLMKMKTTQMNLKKLEKEQADASKVRYLTPLSVYSCPGPFDLGFPGLQQFWKWI